MHASDVQTRQFLRLVDQLGKELGHRRGWVSAVARKIGVHRSTLVKLLSGERPVTATLLERTAHTLNLDLGFFAERAELDGDPYTKWLQDEVLATIDANSPTGWAAVVRAYEELVDATIQVDGVPKTLVEARLRRLVDELSHVPLLAAYDEAAALLERPRRREDEVELAVLRLLVAVDSTLRGLRARK